MIYIYRTYFSSEHIFIAFVVSIIMLILWVYIHTDTYVEKYISGHGDIQIHKHTGTQTHRYADRQTLASTYIDGRADRETERQTCCQNQTGRKAGRRRVRQI